MFSLHAHIRHDVPEIYDCRRWDRFNPRADERSTLVNCAACDCSSTRKTETETFELRASETSAVNRSKVLDPYLAPLRQDPTVATRLSWQHAPSSLWARPKASRINRSQCHATCLIPGFGAFLLTSYCLGSATKYNLRTTLLSRNLTKVSPISLDMCRLSMIPTSSFEPCNKRLRATYVLLTIACVLCISNDPAKTSVISNMRLPSLNCSVVALKLP